MGRSRRGGWRGRVEPLASGYLPIQALARAELLLKEKIEASPNPKLRPRELARRKERLAAKLLRGSRRRLCRADTRPAGKKIVKPPRRSIADSQTPQR